jgi:hypothetical protein
MADEACERQVVTGGVVVSMQARAAGLWEPWLDERGLANHYRVSTRTIRRWRASGMPSRVFGGVRRYRLSACEHWHEQRGAA